MQWAIAGPHSILRLLFSYTQVNISSRVHASCEGMELIRSMLKLNDISKMHLLLGNPDYIKRAPTLSARNINFQAEWSPPRFP